MKKLVVLILALLTSSTAYSIMFTKIGDDDDSLQLSPAPALAANTLSIMGDNLADYPETITVSGITSPTNANGIYTYNGIVNYPRWRKDPYVINVSENDIENPEWYVYDTSTIEEFLYTKATTTNAYLPDKTGYTPVWGTGTLQLSYSTPAEVLLDAIGAASTDNVADVQMAVDGKADALKNRFILLGDSLTAQSNQRLEYLPTASKQYAESIGYMNWARCFLHAPINIVTNMAVSGGETEDTLAILDDIKEVDADYAMVCLGKNDDDNVSSVGAISNLALIVEGLMESGKKVVLLNVTPTENDATDLSRQIRSEINQWISNAPLEYPDLVTVDIKSAVMDYTTGNMFTNAAWDGGTHWSTLAAMRIGMKVADALNEILPPGNYEWYPATSPLNIATDPSLIGTGWTFPNNGGSGTVAYAESAEYFGNTATLSFTNATSYSAIYELSNVAGGLWTNGNTIAFQADIEWEIDEEIAGEVGFYPYLWMRIRNADSSFEVSRYAFLTAGSQLEPNTKWKDGRGIFRTPNYTIGPNVTQIYWYVGFYGIKTGTITIHRFSAFKVAE